MNDKLKHILLALLVGLLIGSICWWYQHTFERAAGDYTWPLCAARSLLAGTEPYQTCDIINGKPMTGPTNPMTTILALLPFVWLPDTIVAGTIIGGSSALLCWIFLHTGQPWRLLIFAAAPFWWTVQTAQWAILFLAIVHLPLLYPLIIIKPHIGFPIALLRFSWIGAGIAAAIILITFIIDPVWPIRWLTRTTTYDGFIPMLSPAAPLFLLSLWRWRDERSRWFILYALMPQRFFYDQLLFFLIPQTPRQMLILNTVSWVTYIGWFLYPVGQLWLLLFFATCLALILLFPAPPWLKRLQRGKVTSHR